MTIKPQGKGDNAIVMSAKVSAKAPEHDLPDSLFFTDVDGGLHRDDPTQARLFADANVAKAKEA